MDSKPELTYWKIYGRAEPARMLMSHLKIEWTENNNISFPPTAEDKELSEFKSFPFLKMDGKKIGQSRGILRYIAAKHGLYPKEPYDLWRMESLLDHYADLESAMYKVFFAPEDKKEEEGKKFGEGILTTTLKILENRLKENSSQEYLVGDGLTPADVVYVSFVYSAALNPKHAEAHKEKQDKFRALLATFPTAEAYFNKRKGDFPRLETREP